MSKNPLEVEQVEQVLQVVIVLKVFKSVMEVKVVRFLWFPRKCLMGRLVKLYSL